MSERELQGLLLGEGAGNVQVRGGADVSLLAGIHLEGPKKGGGEKKEGDMGEETGMREMQVKNKMASK